MSAVPSVDFSLRDLTLEVIASSEPVAPREIADRVASLVPVEHLRSALAEALVDWVRVRMNQERQAVRKYSTETEVTGSSTRWSGIGAVYTRFLNEIVSVPDVGRKRRGEITLAEQRSIAAFRRSQAAAIAKEARREAMLADAMEKAGAETVADLPEVVALEILRWEPKK